MQSTEKNSDAVIYTKEHRSRHCAVRMVGRAGYQLAESHRRCALRDVVRHCSSAAPLTHRRVTRKPVVRRIRPESALQKDSRVDGLMALLSDHAYLSQSNHRRSSLPMDYRWLAGMKPKWYANVKKRRSVPNQQDTVKFDNKTSVQNITGMSSCKIVSNTEVDHRNISQSLLALLTTDSHQPAGVEARHYSNEKYTHTQSVAASFDNSREIFTADGSYVIVNDSSDPNVFLLAPLVPVSTTQCSESDRRTGAIKQRLHKRTVSSIRHCDVDKTNRRSEVGSLVHSGAHDVMYSGAICCLSRCDCFCFFDSSSAEHTGDTVPTNTMSVDGLVTYAGYVSCRGSHRVTCDLHLVGALETVSDNTEPAACGNGQLASAADSYEHEDFVDNICVDCGCELTGDDMLECAYSVPICAICSLVANHDIPSVESSVMSDHGYACVAADRLAYLSPLKETPSSSYAIPVYQQPGAPDVDVVDDITFLSFPSKVLMHRYILTQCSHCDPAVKSSWMELARCERTWHAGHKSHRRSWFGSARNRHMDRFSAHNRLHEQIRLGLVRPVSAQNSADLLGIKLKTSLSQNSAGKTVVGRKCKNRHVLNDLQTQRPTRMAAKGQYYCLTRFRPKGSALKALLEAEHVDIMKLTQQQAEEALKLLHIPSVITRNNCSQPGCRFGCICSLFANGRFASLIGAEFSPTIALPELPVIDDSWRQSLSSSADSSIESSVEDSPLRLSSSDTRIAASARSVLFSPANLTNVSSGVPSADAASLSLPQFRVGDKKYRGKRRAKTTRDSNASDSHVETPSLSFPNKRRRLKRRLSVDEDDRVEGSGSSAMQGPLKRNLSQTLPVAGDSRTQPGETQTLKRRRLKRNRTEILPSGGDERGKAVIKKRRRKSSVSCASLLRTWKNTSEDTTVSASHVQALREVQGNDAEANDVHIASSAAGSATASSCASVPRQLCLQNLSTGDCYVLQPVAKGDAHTAGVRGIALCAVRPVLKAVDAAKRRLLLPPESGHVGVVGRAGTSAVMARLSHSSAIPRLTLVPTSQPTSSPSDSSRGNGSWFISAATKHRPSSSPTSPVIGGSAVHSVSSALASAPNVPKHSSSPKSVPGSSASSSSTAGIEGSSTSTFTDSIGGKRPAQPFRTQMILFQQAGRPHLLEIASNCAWERSRPRVLARLSELTRVAGGYPRPSAASVDGFRVEVQPRPRLPTQIPARLRESLGMSSMFAIRVRISAEGRPSATTGSVVVPRSAGAAELSSSTLRDCNDVDVGSVGTDRRATTVDLIQQKTNADASQQNTAMNIPRPPPTSAVDTRCSTQERNAVDVGRQATASITADQREIHVDLTPQSATADVSRHTESRLSADAANTFGKDIVGVSRSGTAGDVVEIRPKPVLGPEAVGAAAEDTRDCESGCYHVDTGSCVNHRISASSCACSDGTGRCAALQQRGEDAAVIRNDVNSISAECAETVSSCLRADDGNFLLAADSVNFPSSSGQTLHDVDCAEVTCSPHADDGNFSSSSGLNVPIGCPLDLCT